MNVPLHELLSRCLAGESDAVTELIHRFRPWALHLAMATVEDIDGAEDVVQEAFLTAIRRLPDLREPEAFPGWFKQIVRTHAHRILRIRRELPLTEDMEANGEALTTGERLIQDELRAQVRDALHNLPGRGREAAELFYLDDLSCAEISGLLDVPTGTVRRRLHDARKRLRSMLLGYVVDQGDRDERRER